MIRTNTFSVFMKPVKTVSACKKQWISYSVPVLPEIRIPIPLKATLKKVIKKKLEKEREIQKEVSRRGTKTIPVITCKKDKLNHHKGQVYDKFKALEICSQSWFHKKSAGDYFLVQGFESNPALNREENTEYDSKDNNFSDFGLCEDVLRGLEKCNIQKPTNIQKLLIPPALKKKNLICAAETGSGKTLAYLAPIIHNILDYKQKEKEIPYNSPLGLVLVPGRELAKQISDVAKQLTRDLEFKTKVLVGGRGAPQALMYDPQIQHVDLMVCTLGALNRVVYTKNINIDFVKHLIIDEADTMLDDSFNRSLIKFMKRFAFLDNRTLTNSVESVPLTQLCLVGATLSKDVVNTLGTVLDVGMMEKITTTHLHRIMPHVPQKFLRLRKFEKPAKVIELVKNDLKKKKPVIIFCKNCETSQFLSMFLRDANIKNCNINGDMPASMRAGKFDEFQNGECDVVVCTDIASRGLDTVRVQHVINYDFPRFVSDYIHRTGRTGRVGSKVTGHVTSLVAHKCEVELVQKIETSIRLMESLPNVNANIKRKLRGTVERDSDSESEEESEQYI